MGTTIENQAPAAGLNRKLTAAPLSRAYTQRHFACRPDYWQGLLTISTTAKTMKRTSAFLGEINTKLSGLASLNIKDSTLNWDPRLRTEKKSTPKTLANSLETTTLSAKYTMKRAQWLRCLRDNFCNFKELKVHDGMHRQVFEKECRMCGDIAVVPICQCSVAVSWNSSQTVYQIVNGKGGFRDIRTGAARPRKRRARMCR